MQYELFALLAYEKPFIRIFLFHPSLSVVINDILLSLSLVHAYFSSSFRYLPSNTLFAGKAVPLSSCGEDWIVLGHDSSAFRKSTEATSRQFIQEMVEPIIKFLLSFDLLDRHLQLTLQTAHKQEINENIIIFHF